MATRKRKDEGPPPEETTGSRIEIGQHLADIDDYIRYFGQQLGATEHEEMLAVRMLRVLFDARNLNERANILALMFDVTALLIIVHGDVCVRVSEERGERAAHVVANTIEQLIMDGDGGSAVFRVLSVGLRQMRESMSRPATAELHRQQWEWMLEANEVAE